MVRLAVPSRLVLGDQLGAQLTVPGLPQRAGRSRSWLGSGEPGHRTDSPLTREGRVSYRDRPCRQPPDPKGQGVRSGQAVPTAP